MSNDDLYNPRPGNQTWQGDDKNFDLPKTDAMYRFLDTEVNNRSRVVGLSIEPDGVFIYTDSSKWCDDAGAGTFRADSETAAIRDFRERVMRRSDLDAWDEQRNEAAATKAGDVQGMAREPISYEQAVDGLIAIMATANYADSDSAVDWTQPRDARQSELYGEAQKLLERIAGREFVEHLTETAEADMSLARPSGWRDGHADCEKDIENGVGFRDLGERYFTKYGRGYRAAAATIAKVEL